MVIRIIIKFEKVRLGISFEIATAAPVLVFSMEYRVTNERDITIKLIAPKRNKNSFCSSSPTTSFPINAACEEPKPGRKAVKGLAIIEAKADFAKEDFDSLICFKGKIFCSGIFVFWLILKIKPEAPNKPVNKGNKDSFKFKFKVAIPKKPDSKKMNNAKNFFFISFSDNIKNPEIKIKIIHIIL